MLAVPGPTDGVKVIVQIEGPEFVLLDSVHIAPVANAPGVEEVNVTVPVGAV